MTVKVSVVCDRCGKTHEREMFSEITVGGLTYALPGNRQGKAHLCTLCTVAFEKWCAAGVEGFDQVLDCASLFPDLERDLAIFKIVEEMGEVADAVIGIEGTNPRKGVYATEADLRKELLDVGLTALIAVVVLDDPEARPHAQPPVEALLQHAADRAARHRAEVARIDEVGRERKATKSPASPAGDLLRRDGMTGHS